MAEKRKSMSHRFRHFHAQVSEVRACATARQPVTLDDCRDAAGQVDYWAYAQGQGLYWLYRLAGHQIDHRDPTTDFSITEFLTSLERLNRVGAPYQRLGTWLLAVCLWTSFYESAFWFVVYWVLWFYDLLAAVVFLFPITVILRHRIDPSVDLGFNSARNVTQADLAPEGKRRSSHDANEPLSTRRKAKLVSDLWETWRTRMGYLVHRELNDRTEVLEKFRNAVTWCHPYATLYVIGVLTAYVVVCLFGSVRFIVKYLAMCVGVEMFIFLPLRVRYPKYRRLFSILNWHVWPVPDDTTYAMQMLHASDTLAEFARGPNEPAIASSLGDCSPGTDSLPTIGTPYNSASGGLAQSYFGSFEGLMHGEFPRESTNSFITTGDSPRSLTKPFQRVKQSLTKGTARLRALSSSRLDVGHIGYPEDTEPVPPLLAKPYSPSLTNLRQRHRSASVVSVPQYIPSATTLSPPHEPGLLAPTNALSPSPAYRHSLPGEHLNGTPAHKVPCPAIKVESFDEQGALSHAPPPLPPRTSMGSSSPTDPSLASDSNDDHPLPAVYPSAVDSHSSSDSIGSDSARPTLDYRCFHRGVPGHLIIEAENFYFRKSRSLGSTSQDPIPLAWITGVKKSTTTNLLFYKALGLEVDLSNQRVLSFANVQQRDEAFQILLIRSGQKWHHV